MTTINGPQSVRLFSGQVGTITTAGRVTGHVCGPTITDLVAGQTIIVDGPAAALGVPRGEARPPRDRAFLVGINAYPGCPLAGCVNDICKMDTWLTSGDGPHFAEDAPGVIVRRLTDGEATTAAILAGLAWLVDGAAAGDRLLFHYSGHGATVPDSDGDEPDGVHDVICPVDFDWTPERMIGDKQFVAVFGPLPAGVKFNWISDSCHSGHLDRGIFAAAERYRSGNRVKVFGMGTLAPMAVANEDHVAARMLRGGRRRPVAHSTLNVGFVAGCRSNQTSADTVIDGEPAGALTGYLLKTLVAMSTTTPLNELVIHTAAALGRDGYEQIPQADGARASLPLLG